MSWGVGLGSSIRKTDLPWVVSFDSHHRNYPAVSTVRHPENFFAQPSNDQMQVLSARLGLSSANPVAAGLAAYSKMLETLDGLLGPADRTSSQWTGFGRIDIEVRRPPFNYPRRNWRPFEFTGRWIDAIIGDVRHSQLRVKPNRWRVGTRPMGSFCDSQPDGRHARFQSDTTSETPKPRHLQPTNKPSMSIPGDSFHKSWWIRDTASPSAIPHDLAPEVIPMNISTRRWNR